MIACLSIDLNLQTSSWLRDSSITCYRKIYKINNFISILPSEFADLVVVDAFVFERRKWIFVTASRVLRAQEQLAFEFRAHCLGMNLVNMCWGTEAINPCVLHVKCAHYTESRCVSVRSGLDTSPTILSPTLIAMFRLLVNSIPSACSFWIRFSRS